ncbi:MAG: amino acid ABC transporter substrate-binding protein [Chloroflexi bacterium]|nr:amino acid ABC transporter substrate-binding protein [Chloroflexota bacterium]
MDPRGKFLWWVLPLALVVAGTLAAAGCSATGQQAGDSGANVLKIGAALSASGSLAHEGDVMKKGYELWKDTVNEKGGLNVGGKKYKVDMVYYDDKSDATTAGKLVEKLITEDKVDFIFGPFGSGISAAASAISEKYKKIFIATIANADTVYSRGFKYLFGILPPTTSGFGLNIDYLATLTPKPTKLAIIYPDDLFPASAAEAAKKKGEQMGFQFVFFQKYPKGTTDLSSIMTQVKAANPDALLNSGYMEDEVMMVKAAKELKFNVKYISSLGMPVFAFMKALGKDSDYLFDAQWWMPQSGWKGPFFGSSQDYNALYKKKYNEDATYYSAAASAGGLVLQTAIGKADSLDVEKVRAELAKTDMETFFGQIKYDETGFNRTGKGVIIQMKDGKINIVYPQNLATTKAVYPIPDWDKR